MIIQKGRRTITIDGKPLLDFGIWLNGEASFMGAEADVYSVSVPGRNGDLTFFDGRYNNVQISYDCYMFKDFFEAFDDLKAFLLSNPNYRRIEGDHDIEHYRIGRISGGISVKKLEWVNEAAQFLLKFDCKPQRWLKDGEIERTMTKSGSLVNPTPFEALPVIRVTGTGSIFINGAEIEIAQHGTIPYIDIDFELGDAYSGSVNCNRYISLNSDNFPPLVGGENLITMSEGIAELKIRPRWWEL